METVREEKARLRAWVRRQRREQPQERLMRESKEICQRLLALPELERARTVFCYVSCGGEVETHRLIVCLLEREKRVLTPRCRENGRMDCVPITGMEQLRPGAYGILEPLPELEALPPEAVDFAVIPALACGLDGSRLGQGGGYYDRFFAGTDCASAALCQECFLLPTVPCEAHDRRMKRIVSSQRTLCFEDV